MAFKRKCKPYTRDLTNSLKSTTSFLESQELIDKFGNIKDLPQFRQAAQWLKEEANKKGYFPDLLVYDIEGGKKIAYNIPAFKKLDGINAQIEKIAESATIERDLFSNPEELYNKAFELSEKEVQERLKECS